MGILHFRTGTWILRPESISVTCNSLFVGLPLLQVQAVPLFRTLNEKIAPEIRKRKTWTALTNRVWLTHQGGMSQRPFLTSKESNGMVYFGRRKITAVHTKSASWRKLGSIADDRKWIFSHQVSSAFQAAQPETDRPSWCNISNCCWLGHW